MKKISLLVIALLGLMMASCDDDYTDWTNPQSHLQGDMVSFGDGSVTEVGLIDLTQVEDELVQVCNIVAPTATDTTLTPYYKIVLGDNEYDIDADGYISASLLDDYVASLYGRETVEREITATLVAYMTDGLTTVDISSEEFTIRVIPTPTPVPTMWYLVGEAVGDGSWNNSEDAIGAGLVPMYPHPDDFADMQWAGYLEAGKGFKLVKTPGSWDEQWGMSAGELVQNDPGAGNITVDEDGIYMVLLNLNANTLEIVKMDDVPNVYTVMNMPGDYNGWNAGSGNPMTAVTSVAENHDWIETVTYETNVVTKFAAGSWSNNWGGTTFPVGVGVRNGGNVPADAGTYRVMFNDILYRYYFLKL